MWWPWPFPWWWPALLGLLWALFIAPGLLVAVLLNRRYGLSERFVVPVAALVGCGLGYGTFWLFVINHRLGQWFSVRLAVAETLCAVACVAWPPCRAIIRQIDVAGPLVLVYLVALTYLGLLSATCVGPGCLTAGYPVDLALPDMYASNFWNGVPLARVGDWLFTDRPPLQTGVVLAHAFFTESGWPVNPSYPLLASLLQCLWVVALWALLRRLRISPGRMAVAMALCMCLGFFLFNSVYVWPKLVAAATAGIGLLLLAESRRRLHWLLGSAGISLGLLCHTGVIFTLVPLAALLLFRRYRPPLPILGLAAAVGLVALVPWHWYQTYVDPPGNRLLKWHLADSAAVDGRSFGQALHDAYANSSWLTILANKGWNVVTLVSPIGDSLRQVEFFHAFPALGLLNLGWVVLAVRRRALKEELDLETIRFLLGGALVSLAFYCLVMFGPATTFIHQGSYLTMMMLAGGLAALVATLPRRMSLTVLALSASYFTWVWVIVPLRVDGHVGRDLVWFVVGGMALLVVLVRFSRSRPSAVLSGPVIEADVLRVDGQASASDGASRAARTAG